MSRDVVGDIVGKGLVWGKLQLLVPGIDEHPSSILVDGRGAGFLPNEGVRASEEGYFFSGP